MHQHLLVFGVLHVFCLLDSSVPRYFILLDAMVYEIVSLISPSDLSLLSCRLLRKMRLETLPSSLLELGGERAESSPLVPSEPLRPYAEAERA